MGTIFSGSIGISIEKMEKKSIGTGIDKIWYKKSRNRYRKNLVLKKVPVSVSKIFSTGKKYRYRYRPTFWVPSHTDQHHVLHHH